MKTFFTLPVFLLCLSMNAQVFDFYNTIYYIPETLQVAEPGMSLTNSGNNLSTFNFSTSSLDHPLYDGGVFFAVNDCSNQNLWVHLRHIAADPNGIENGHAISNSLNSPFLPNGATDRIGGWNGFYYEFQIFQDFALTGERTNVLGELYPTGITVASLETLYNDGGYLYEWLAFEILNSESSGWFLNSTNFTGINPYSTPGFSAELNYATTGTPTSAPTGFSTDFPYGSQNIYAVDMNLSNSYHSEFKMSAAGVTKFRYGYEFTIGGYQGMSMSFGVPPVVNALLQPSCGEASGAISLEVTGTEPISIEWGNDATGSVLTELNAGDYSVIVTDGNGCAIEQVFSIAQFDPFSAVITIVPDQEFLILQSAITGGTFPYSFQWSNGSTESFVSNPEPGLYTVEITDGNGCYTTASYTVVGIEEYSNALIETVFPNPILDVATFSFSVNVSSLAIYDHQGKLIRNINVQNGTKTLSVDLKDQTAGMYFYTLMNDHAIVQTGKLIVE